MRNRLVDFMTSRGPEAIGLCGADRARIARMLNSAQQRLLLCAEAGDEGWMGTWAEMAFTVSATDPYITTPRGVARLEKVQVCQTPVIIQNQFYEYLEMGCGSLPKTCQTNIGNVCDIVAYSRNNVPTFTDLSAAPQQIRIYTSDSTGVDVGKRVLVQGTDSSSSTLYSIDSNVQVQGVFATLAAPFVDVTVSGVAVQFNTITGIQKDVTVAPIQIFQVDPTTGEEVLIHIMDPSEKVASYRRYYFHSLPAACCNSTDGDLVVTAIAKLELIPVVAETDYLLIQNIEALISECQAIRYSEIDSEVAKKMRIDAHKEAIRFLQGEIVHLTGKEKPAMSFHPFGSVGLEWRGVGMI